MDSFPWNRSHGRAGREACRRDALRGLQEAAFCILALECSQVLYRTVSRPDLSGPLARTLVASASVSVDRTSAVAETPV